MARAFENNPALIVNAGGDNIHYVNANALGGVDLRGANLTLTLGGITITSGIAGIMSTPPSPPIIHATERGDELAVANLLKEGVDVNTRSINGSTPLIIACHKGNATLAALLLDNGADVHVTMRYDDCPLIVTACQQGKVEVARLLLEKGADVNTKYHGIPLLINALPCWHKEQMVDLLLSHGANVRDKDNNGKTVIAHIHVHHMPIPFTLLIHGADAQDIDQRLLKQPALKDRLLEAMHIKYDSILDLYISNFQALVEAFHMPANTFNIGLFIKDKLPMLSEMLDVTIDSDGRAITPKVLSLRCIAMKKLLKNLDQTLAEESSKAYECASKYLEEHSLAIAYAEQSDEASLSGAESNIVEDINA